MTHQSTGSVDLSLPADPRYLRLARMMAGNVATDFGATEDDAVELRMAVDEAGAVLIHGAGPDDRLSVECVFQDGWLVVTLTSSAPSRGPLVPHPVAEAILAWSVQRYEVEHDQDGCDRIRLIKPINV